MDVIATTLKHGLGMQSRLKRWMTTLSGLSIQKRFYWWNLLLKDVTTTSSKTLALKTLIYLSTWMSLHNSNLWFKGLDSVEIFKGICPHFSEESYGKILSETDESYFDLHVQANSLNIQITGVDFFFFWCGTRCRITPQSKQLKRLIQLA